MKIQECFDTAYSYAPSTDRVVKSAATMTVAAVALETLLSITGAEAGPLTYACCLTGCAFATPPALPFCLAACAPSLGPWCP